MYCHIVILLTPKTVPARLGYSKLPYISLWHISSVTGCLLRDVFSALALCLFHLGSNRPPAGSENRIFYILFIHCIHFWGEHRGKTAHLHIVINTGQQLLKLIWPQDLSSIEAHLQFAFDGGIPVIFHCIICPVNKYNNTVDHFCTQESKSAISKSSSELMQHCRTVFTFQGAAWRSQPSGFQADGGPCRWRGPPPPSKMTSSHWDWGGCASVLYTASPIYPSDVWLPLPTVCCRRDSQAL